MIKIITYVAADGTEFDNEFSCKRHENELKKYVDEFTSKITFFDENKQKIEIYAERLEEALGNIIDAYDVCTYLKLTEMLSSDCKSFIYYQTGMLLPKKSGMFKYNFNKGGWELCK